MSEINLMDLYPRSKRPIEERGALITEKHREVAREFGEDFFDGDRLFGYGGFTYHPRFWQGTVKRLRDHYELADDANILDVGCAKGFMLHDFTELMPEATVAGIEISQYALDNCMETVKPFTRLGNAKELPYEDNSFDFVISINTVHNLVLEECKQAVREIERVSRGNSFIMVDAWRNDAERDLMMKWVLTGLTMMHAEEWRQLFVEVGYTGDYYWFLPE